MKTTNSNNIQFISSPKNITKLKNDHAIFLAGPIQGADDWQSKAARILEKKISETKTKSNYYIFSPRKSGRRIGEDFKHQEFKSQVEWEHRYLSLAANTGVILFWLSDQTHEVIGRSYAQTTRLELGFALGLHLFRNVRVVVGIDKNFTNARYIRKMIHDLTKYIPICETLEDTCKKAVEQLDLPKSKIEKWRKKQHGKHLFL